MDTLLLEIIIRDLHGKLLQIFLRGQGDGSVDKALGAQKCEGQSLDPHHPHESLKGVV